MKKIILSNGIEMPNIAFGTWKLDSGLKTTEAVLNAINAGYRCIDCAYSYGNDFFVGKAIKNCKVAREDLFIVNKLWNDFSTKDQIIEVCRKSLKLMKLDYFDLYLIHWPSNDDNQNFIRWQAMEEIYKLGLAKAIGVSNFSIAQLEALKKFGATIWPMVNQIEFHPGFMQKELVSYCKQNKIVVQAYSPLASGGVFKNKILYKIAKENNKSVAQITLRWIVQHNIMPIPRAQDYNRIINNFDVFNFDISHEEMRQIDDIHDIDGNLFNLSGK